MKGQQRLDAVKRLEDLRDSRVLVYFLSDRRVVGGATVPGMSTQLAGEAYPVLYQHLRSMAPRPERLDLVLYTAGGNVDSVWPLVQLCRAFTRRFAILVPMKALSAGTLCCLGADEVLLGEASTLSPIDPTTSNPFNPRTPDGSSVPISVEDVTAYLALASGKGSAVGPDPDTEKSVKLELTEETSKLEVFKELTRNVHPLALGNVKRVHSQIRWLASQLLELHLTDKKRRERIVSVLTEELFSHSHQIGRSQAVSILGSDLAVVPTAELEDAMWDLHRAYADSVELYRPFALKEWIANDPAKELSVCGARMESRDVEHEFVGNSVVRQVSQLPESVQVQLPPGQLLPLIPGLPTNLLIEHRSDGWYSKRPQET